MSEATVAVLFARSDSIYKSIPGCDVWDIERDALNWPGGVSARGASSLPELGTPSPVRKAARGEKELALWAVNQVRKFGGVLEHPEGSTLWIAAALPAPGKQDDFGGWTVPIHQHSFGHRAEKSTLLYIVGCNPRNLPAMPLRMDEVTHCIRPTKSYPRKPSVTKAEREHTPPLLAEWLVSVARLCKAPV